MTDTVSIALPHIPMGMSMVLFATVMVLLLVLWNFHRDKANKVDLKDLICHEGQINEAKFCRFGAFVVSTWGFVYLVLTAKLGEWYFAGYMAAWAGNALLGKYLEIKKMEITTAPPTPQLPPGKPVI